MYTYIHDKIQERLVDFLKLFQSLATTNILNSLINMFWMRFDLN